MSSPKISKDNYELLSHLKKGEIINADRKGKLYLVNQTFLTQLFQKIFHNQRHVQQIVQGFVVEKLQEKQFHVLTSGRNAYLELLNQFAITQLSGEQRASLAFDFYNQRYRDLLTENVDPWRAECQIVLEMLEDPNIPSSYKEGILPEEFGGGVYLKDRAGRKIATIKSLSTSLSKAETIISE